MNLRKLSILLLGILLTGTTVFAGGSGEAGTDSGPIELRYTLWSGNEAHLALFRGIADAYIAENPNVGVEYQTIPHGSYLRRLPCRHPAATPRMRAGCSSGPERPLSMQGPWWICGAPSKV